MKIATSINKINNRYVATVDVVEFSNLEKEFINKFGSPVIELGGLFEGDLVDPNTSELVSVSFSLPTKPRRLDVDFPQNQIFDSFDFVDAPFRAKLFIDTIVSRITLAKSILMSKNAPFVGEFLTTI